jgi:hypothetical protein
MDEFVEYMDVRLYRYVLKEELGIPDTVYVN